MLFLCGFGHMTGGFMCSNMGLTTLAGAPHTVGRAFMCEGNDLTTLVGAPKTCGSFAIRDNPLKDLNGFPDQVHMDTSVTYTSLLPLLQLFKSKQVTLHRVKYHSNERSESVPAIVMEIFEDRTDADPRKAAIHAAAKLVKAGLKDNARW